MLEKDLILKKIKPKIIKDSRKNPTLEIELFFNKIKTKSSVPQGKSRGSQEAFSIDPLKSIKIINQKIWPKIKDKKFKSIEEFDNFLIKLDQTKNKKNLGGNTILCLSQAFLKALALNYKLPLWLYLKKISYNQEKLIPPKFLVNIFGGGLHAKNNLIFQEYLIIPNFNNPQKALKIALKIYQITKLYLQKNLKQKIKLADEGNFDINFQEQDKPFEILNLLIKKLKLKNNILFGLDAAASNINLNPIQLFKIYLNLKQKFNLFYLEDPFKEKDFVNFKKILKHLKNTLIVGDDLTTTNLKLINKAYKKESINGVIIKPTQIGSVSETIKAILAAKKLNLKTIVSHRSGETNDNFISDLAAGLSVDFLKAGAPSQKERLIKYQRIIEIEKEKIFFNN